MEGISTGGNEEGESCPPPLVPVARDDSFHVESVSMEEIIGECPAAASDAGDDGDDTGGVEGHSNSGDQGRRTPLQKLKGLSAGLKRGIMTAVLRRPGNAAQSESGSDQPPDGAVFGAGHSSATCSPSMPTASSASPVVPTHSRSPSAGSSHAQETEASGDPLAAQGSEANAGGSGGSSSSPVRGALGISNPAFRPSLTRPPILPPKDPREDMRHHRERRKMEREFERRNRKMEDEERARNRQLAAREAKQRRLARVWIDEIAPSFPERRSERRVLSMWRQGIPPMARGCVWPLAVGNPLGVNEELFRVYCDMAHRACEHRQDHGDPKDAERGGCPDGVTSDSPITEQMEHAARQQVLIALDLQRTFPGLRFFQQGSPQHAQLRQVLEAFVCYRSDLGYVQGMSYVAGTLLLFMDPFPAFQCLSGMLAADHMTGFYRMDITVVNGFMAAFARLLEEAHPAVHANLAQLGVTPEMYFFDWTMTLFSRSLSLECAARVWDVYFLDGVPYLFRVGLGIFQLFRDTFSTGGFDDCTRQLGNLSTDVTEDQLFRAIAAIKIKDDRISEVLDAELQTRKAEACAAQL